MTDFSRKRTKPEDWEDIEPSKVIHIRELAEHTLEIDVCRALEKYGIIRDIAMIPKRRQALVEFESLQSALEVVKKFRNDSIYIANRPAKVNYSTSEHVLKRSGPQNESVSSSNKVLIFFIYDAIYPINVDVINKICKPHGKVVRIFINRKASVMQALVEFYTLDDAVRVKRNLNGADIYSGCCTLKIEYATTSRVNVIQNNEDSVDYESPNISVRNSHSLLGLPNTSDITSSSRTLNMERRNDVSYNGSGSGRNSGYYDDRRDLSRRMVPLNNSYNHHHHGYHDNNSRDSDTNFHSNSGGSSGPRVSMIYGLNLDNVNCDILFNLLCIYGNVIKIKFLKSKEGSAMVQMGDRASMERMMHLLHNQTFFGKTLQFQISKQPVIIDVPTPYKLPDGSESFKDFSKCRENRFVTPEQAEKNRVFPPSRTINYWNAPPDFTLDMIRSQFLKYNAVEPPEFLQLTNRDKSSSGLLQWNSVEDAINAISLCNHIMIAHDGAKFPYQLKLSFSESPIRHRSMGGSGGTSRMEHDDEEGDEDQNNMVDNSFHRGGGGGQSRDRMSFGVVNNSSTGSSMGPGTGGKRSRY